MTTAFVGRNMDKEATRCVGSPLMVQTGERLSSAPERFDCGEFRSLYGWDPLIEITFTCAERHPNPAGPGGSQGVFLQSNAPARLPGVFSLVASSPTRNSVGGRD